MPLDDPDSLLPGGFWAAVTVWLERPQVANKRLCGARIEARGRTLRPSAQAECGPRQGQGHGLEREPGQGSRADREGTAPAADLDLLWNRVSQSLVHSNPEILTFYGPSLGSPPEAAQELDLVLRTVIPKASPHFPFTEPKKELVVQDVSSGSVTFLPLEEDNEENLEVKMSNVYQLRLHHSEGEWFISVLIFCPERWHSDGVVYPKPTWLAEELLSKLARWAVENRKSEFKSTLSLVSVLRYGRMYQELKEKYRDMVKVWPEVTDPEKFVYEDVAIATYLLILWEEERAEKGITTKQSFVDLGCGNGLLVHILSNEGHPGRGIDVRRRKIWDMYGPQTQLEGDTGGGKARRHSTESTWTSCWRWGSPVASTYRRTASGFRLPSGSASLGNPEHTCLLQRSGWMSREHDTCTADRAFHRACLVGDMHLLYPRLLLTMTMLVTRTVTGPLMLGLSACQRAWLLSEEQEPQPQDSGCLGSALEKRLSV